MNTFKHTLMILAATSLMTSLSPAHSKQLAEQLVSLTVKEPSKASQSQTPQRTIREGGRTVGAGQVQRRNDSHSQSGKTRLIIEKEGANVKKEKGVEDVE